MGKSKHQDTKSEAVDKLKERHRELRGKYMKVCRENARLRRELDKWLSFAPEEMENETLEIKKKKVQTCPSTNKNTGVLCGGKLDILSLGIHTLYICKKCNWRKREQTQV